MSRAAVLVLGGTAEATALARRLTGDGGKLRVVSSLAGRTASPRLPPGEVRVGGFGGPTGLAEYLCREAIRAVVDATHPFAARMGWNAAAACAQAGVPLVRLDRPAWSPGPRDRWTGIESWEEAAARLHEMPRRRIFLAVGRQELASFAGLENVWFLLRFAEQTRPDPAPATYALIADRGPFTIERERSLLLEQRIDLVICRNSGGEAARAKLDAAAELGIEVLMRRRPDRPPVPRAENVETAAAWIMERFPAG